MGKKGKIKNQTANNQNAPEIKSENTEKELKIQETVTEVLKIEQFKDEPVIVETLAEDGNESKDGTLKSKKRRNRKKKNATTEIKVDELNEEKTENLNQKEELLAENQMKSKSNEEIPVVESTDTLKKKRRRNRKKNVAELGEVQDEKASHSVKNENTVEIVNEKPVEDTETSQQNTLKRKRNRNKNKKVTVNKDHNESVVEESEKPLQVDLPQQFETKDDQTEKPEPQRRGKKQKRFDLSSKKTILDELQERQEREQKEARDHIKKEIAKREKLLETIDLVLDCHKSEVELAKNQQESLKDVKLLSQEAAKPRPQLTSSSPSKSPKQSASKKSSPVEEELANKIEQVLGMTKLEIKNAQTQQAYVNRLEAEVAKVKQSKDILLGGQPSSAVPTHIQKMAKEMKDISKGEVPKTKEELIKEIESRDVLMSEINRVLDTTKSEIDKVQKQQKIIQNLEVELNKMKEQEVVEKLMLLAEEEDKIIEPPPKPKQSPATASLLDALMANVGKLKEIQALKEKQKAEQGKVEISDETVDKAVALESVQTPEKIDNMETNVENNTETKSVIQKQTIQEKSKSPQKDAKNISNEKKLSSSKEGSPKEHKKHPKDQKKEPQKVHEKKSKAEEMINFENKKDENLIKIDSLKENNSSELKTEKLLKDNIVEVFEMKASENLNECKSKIDEAKQEPIKQKKPSSPKNEHKKKEHNKDKEMKNLENKKTVEVNNSTQEKIEINQKIDKAPESDVKNKEIITSDLKKTESIDEKLKDNNQVMSVEVKPIASSEMVLQDSSKNIKANDQKKSEKDHKTSPRNSHKNKNHNKHDKKNVVKGIPEVIPLVPVTDQKPSMADMLKNAPDPPPEEINKKAIEDVKIDAPLAKAESVIIEVKPSEQIKEIMQLATKVTSDQKELPKALDVEEPAQISPELQEDGLVIVNKEEVEAEIKEEKLNEQDLTDPKNVQRGGFVSLVDNKDAKPLKKDEKKNANKNKTPIKNPPKSTLQKGLDTKVQQNKTINQKPKSEVQAKINSKPTDAKKPSQLATKPLSPTTEKQQPKFESATNVSVDITSSQKTETQNLCHDSSLPSTDKPKVPPRPDVTKTSNTKPVPRTDASDATSTKSQNDQKPILPKAFVSNENDDQFLEYKITPQQIFCASICQVCKVNLSRYFLCNECKMVAYCKEEHMKIDYLNHKGLCMAIQLIAKRRGGHVYNMSKHLSSSEFRNLRLHTIYLCEQFLNRSLLTFEREIFLFPRLCYSNQCREWKSNLLSDCGKCGQISFCSQHPLNESHKLICNSYALFQRIILHEKSYGKINIALPQKVLKKIPILTENVQDIMQLLYKNVTAFQNECINASFMQIATAPLTTFYSIQKVGIEFKEQLTIHFIGAELNFECDRLEKWESLFLHLAFGVTDVQIIFIGSELNYENLPVEIISRTRACKICRQNCCGIRFDFKCQKFYHDYCESSAFVKPDFVCIFNPALHRSGFCGFDTWPKTIEAALKTRSPILVTATTENECYLDLNRIKKISNDEIQILIPPLKNPYASSRPERNFASDDQDSIMFKNNYLFVISKIQDLINL